MYLMRMKPVEEKKYAKVLADAHAIPDGWKWYKCKMWLVYTDAGNYALNNEGNPIIEISNDDVSLKALLGSTYDFALENGHRIDLADLIKEPHLQLLGA